MVSACSTTAQWRVASAALLDRPTTISDGMGNDISAVGYIKLTLIPDPDRSAAMDERPRQTLTVRDCGSGERLSASYLYERSGPVYEGLLAYKDDRAGAYNLATRPLELCVTVQSGSMNPLDAVVAKARIRLTPDLVAEMKKYDQASGAVRVHMAESCSWRMCIPERRPQSP
jgi:hypothetical protein